MKTVQDVVQNVQNSNFYENDQNYREDGHKIMKIVENYAPKKMLLK